MRTRPVALAVAVTAALAAGACSTGGSNAPATAPLTAVPSSSSSGASSSTTTSASTTASPSSSSAASRSTPVPTDRRVVAKNLNVPWALAFLPDGSALLTLRDEARLLQVREGHPPVDLGKVPGVEPSGEGGLLGVAVSPTFARDHTIFLYLTSAGDNRVVRLTFADGKLGQPQPILTGIPRAGNHNGGRLKFGPDGYLYVTTGDAGNRPNAQNRQSLGGKILRVTKDGKPAPGNPFGTSPVWSWGHRNVQGIAWDRAGRMFASEFGQNTWDELNLIKPGANYGWPVVEGRAGRSGFTDPLRQWPTDDASPSGIAITADGTVWMAALRGQSLWRIPTGNGVAGQPQRLLQGEYGRLRDVVVGPDGRLWVLTNNTARGNPARDDDKLVVIPTSTLR